MNTFKYYIIFKNFLKMGPKKRLDLSNSEKIDLLNMCDKINTSSQMDTIVKLNISQSLV